MADCIRCGDPAVAQFSIDIDVAPWPFCDHCRLPVHAAMVAAICGDQKISDQLLRKPKDRRAVTPRGED